MARIGCYPGSFAPATVAHLHIARAAIAQCGLDIVEFVLSTDTLGKPTDTMASAVHRAEAFRSIISAQTMLRVRVSDHQLLADIAEESCADVLIVGADKWQQLIDPVWYGGDPAERDAALRRLPQLAVAPRPPASMPPTSGVLTALDVPTWMHEVSSTAVRRGRDDWRA
jgi:nicotinic acid mononucleotide adenylyltransferase